MKKKILTIAILIYTISIYAQEATIKISTSVTHNDPTPLYKARVTFGSGYSSLPSEVISFENLKQKYLQELDKAGFSGEVLKETPHGFGYETLGHKKEGIIYEYSTSSLQTMRKFMQIRPVGVESLYVVSIIEIDAKETEQLAQSAIAQAKEKALAVAKAMGKKLGNIIYVEDMVNRWGNTIETSVYYDRPPDEIKYSLDVTFSVK